MAARIVSIASIVVAAALVVVIVLVLVAPTIRAFPVGFAFDLGDRLAGPFDNVFPFRRVGYYVATNWGLAAAVYLIVGQLIALLLRRFGTSLRGGSPKSKADASSAAG